MRYIYLFFLLFVSTVATGQVTAGFTADFAAGCSPHVVHFTNTSTGATSYSWNLGNSIITPVTNPSTSYLAVGTYTVTLTAYNGSASSVFTMVITVHPAPTVNLMADDTAVCPGASVLFSTTSSSGVPGPMTYLWNFGDGFTSTAVNPSHVYATPGLYNVSLSVTNSQGCVRTLTRSGYLRVYTPPAVVFTGSPLSICNVPGTVTFANTTTGTPPLSYLWTLEPGITSALTAPPYTYTSPGVYTVKLVATDGNGCKDSLIRPSYVFAGAMNAAFTYPATACVYSGVTFTNTSSVHATRTWNYGDGSATDTIFNGNHIYTTDGTYMVTLTIVNGPCVDVETQTITVLPQPFTDFAFSPVHPCPAPVTVSYLSAAPPGSTVTWTYEGGATGTGTTGTHTYSTNGVKTIKMIVTDISGCQDTVVKTDTIYGIVFLAIPTPHEGCVPLEVDFSSMALTYQPDSVMNFYPHSVSGFTWDFGDGSPVVSGIDTPTHTYTAVGIYTAFVTATTDNGCVVTDTTTISVGTPPVVTFTATPTHICFGDHVDFWATVISGPVSTYEWSFGDYGLVTTTPGTSHTYLLPGIFTVTVTPFHNGCPGLPVIRTNYITVDSPKSIIDFRYSCDTPTRVAFFDSSMGADSHLWMFGDGTTSTLDHPVHDYPSIGTYTVSLATYNVASGCRDTSLWVIDLVSPVVDFTADDTTLCEGGIVNFTTTVSGGSVLSYRWYVNGVTKPWKTQSTLTDTFNVAGLYTIMLVYENFHECLDTVIKVNYITIGRPVAAFTAAPVPGCWPLTVTFTDASTDVPGVALTGFYWNFGDGGTATVGTPVTTHTYTNPGTFTVTEIVTDAIGCMDTLTQPSLVVVYKPNPVFTASNVHPCANVPITFNNTSVGIVSSFWIFGDGGTSALTSPVHTYTANGAYTVRLAVTDAHGCTDTATYVNYINVSKPDAAFGLSDSFSVCSPLLVNFPNTTTGATTYSWSFGDGNVSALHSPGNIYFSPGYFIIKLIATDAWGCTDTASRSLNIYGYAGALTYSPLTGCAPLTVGFHAAIVNVPHIIWDFGDGTTSTLSGVDTATHVYTIPGGYVPKLILSDNTGCQNSTSGLDTIKVDGITAKFYAWPSACLGIPFQIVDTSTFYWMPVNSRTWTYNGITTSIDSPSYLINTVGNYPVTLQVSNAWGCTAILTDDIIVHPLPVISTSADTVVCVGDPAMLTGYGAQTYAWGPPGTLACIVCNPAPATPSVASTYTVIGTDQYGCKDTADVKVGVRTHTFSNAWSDTAMCLGYSVPLYDTGGSKYTWIPAYGLSSSTISDPIASPASTTSYTVIAQLGGCIPDTDYVKVEVFPVPTVNAGRDQEVMAGTIYQLEASGRDIAAFAWSPAAGLSCDDCFNPKADISVTTTFVVTVTSPYGCKASDSVTLFLFCNSRQAFLPNAFTPNGDGENDVFYPRGAGLSLIKSFRIYNRWGELLFERTNIQVNDAANAWDGSYLGDRPIPDVYVYVVDAVCSTGQPVMIKGDVTIIR